MLIVQVLDENFPSLTSCCLSCQEAVDSLTDGGGYREQSYFGQEAVWNDGVKGRAEVHKEDPHISPWSV